MQISDTVWFALRERLSRVENALADLLEGAPENLTADDMLALRQLVHDIIQLSKLID